MEETGFQSSAGENRSFEDEIAPGETGAAVIFLAAFCSLRTRAGWLDSSKFYNKTNYE
jgi:hypothetical protein